MFKYLRMDAYRLIKTKTLYVALGIILAAVAFSVYMMSTAAMPDLSATGGEGPSSMAIQNGKELGSFTQTQSGLWIWTTVLLVSVVVAQFFALEEPAPVATGSLGLLRREDRVRRHALDGVLGVRYRCVRNPSQGGRVRVRPCGFGPGNRRLVRVAAACPLDVWNAGRDGNLVDAE